MARKPKNIVFETKRHVQTGSLKRFGLVFIILVTAVLAISLLVIVKNYDSFSDVLSGEKETETTKQVSETQPADTLLDATVLFANANTESGEIEFLWVARFTLPARDVRVCSLDPNEIYSGRSFNDAYADNGAVGLTAAVESAYGIDVDRYVVSTNATLKSTVNYLGGITLNIDEQIEFRSGDMTLILVKGEQTVKGDSFYKYLRYLDSLGNEGREKKAQALFEIFEEIFRTKNLDSRSEIYSRISNTLDTDITRVDYTKAESGIVMLMESGFNQRQFTAEITEIF